MGEEGINFLALPMVAIENILAYMSYDEIAKSRLVCKEFNEVCKRMLNRGFLIIGRRHATALKNVKAQLPRRESERQNHPLARHCDILSSIETRISMLSMTYSKYMDSGICCFIPGKVLDEIKHVLQILETNQTPPRAHEVLQELRDLSSMAIEHFDDKISPPFRKKLRCEADAIPEALRAFDITIGPIVGEPDLSLIRRKARMNMKLSFFLISKYKIFSRRFQQYKRLAIRQRKIIREMSLKQSKQEAAIADLKKRIEECDIKYNELIHTNQAVGGKVMAAQASAGAGVTSQPLRHFASQIKLDLSALPIGSNRVQASNLPNIKPRKPIIRLPVIPCGPLIPEDSEPPPKQAKLSDNSERYKFKIYKVKPSTSQATPHKSEPHTTMAKIRKYANEIKSLAKKVDRPNVVLGKRPINLCSLEDNTENETQAKKQKTSDNSTNDPV